MSLEGVALIPRCVECGAIWLPADEERWRAYHGGDDPDEPAELVSYCPSCGFRVDGSRPLVRAEDYLELLAQSTYRGDRVRPT